MRIKPKNKDCIDSIIDAVVAPFEVLTNRAGDCFDSKKNDFNLGEFLGKLFCCSEPKTKENQTAPVPTAGFEKTQPKKISPNDSSGDTPNPSPMNTNTPKVLKIRPIPVRLSSGEKLELWV